MSAVETDARPSPGEAHVGSSLRRKEDPRLLTGRASYVEDIVLPGELWMAVVRSPEAHARIASIDATAALEHPAVRGVFTGENLSDLRAPIPMAWAPPGIEIKAVDHWPLARGEVSYVGDPVAVVVGDDRAAVIDAAEQVVVDYEPLPAVIDVEQALEEGAPLVHEQLGTNRSVEWSISGGDVDAAFEQADVVVERRLINHRTHGAPIETRGCLAEYRAGALVIWTSTQIPYLTRSFLANELGLSEERVRVVAPEVGGGFGTKLNHYGEETLAAWCSRRLGRPVKWIETRSEHMAATTHGRGQVDRIKVGAKRDGTIVALDARVLLDLGAKFQLLTPFMGVFTACVISGCYAIPNLSYTFTGVLTNKVATDAARGAGRPEATHMIEVAIEQLARELDMDVLELRRRNFIPTESFPAQIPTGFIYDSGNYHGTLDKLLEHVDVEAFRREQEQLRARGVYRGIGFSTYVEVCGLAPSRAVGPKGVGLQAGFWESAVVRVHPSGAVTVFTGTSPHGQGHETTFAQIVADRLGCSIEHIDVIHGDTDTGPYGMGTYGSRALAVGGESVLRAAEKVAGKARRIVAHQLEAAPEDIELVDGRYRVRGSPDKAMTLAEVAAAAYVPENLPADLEPGLEEMSFFDPENFVWPFGAHACVVEVDADTGRVDILRYVAVDDCGRAINPMLIDGQIHGGVAHAIGQVLYERIHYDEAGQLVTGTFVDYALPSAPDIPTFETDRQQTLSPVNSLGVKGVGEAGTIAASGAILNAVIDALRPLGVDFLNMPLTPMAVWEAIESARSQGGAS